MGDNILKSLIRYAVNSAHIYINYDHLYREWYYKHSKRLLRFKDMHKGKDCFIIGNGPSLNKMDLSPLKDYHTFGLNKIFLMFDRVDLNLSYHVAVNPLVIEQSAREFEAMPCPSFLSHAAARGIVHSLDNIYFIATGGQFTFQEQIRCEIHEGYTVTYVAMQIAYFMGFNRVFLIGVDHNFKAAGAPNEKQLLKGEDQNHFSPDYFGGKEWHLPDLEASELAYHLAKFHYSRAGRQIVDATVDGKLQIFPKISYERTLEICGKKYN